MNDSGENGEVKEPNYSKSFLFSIAWFAFAVLIVYGGYCCWRLYLEWQQQTFAANLEKEVSSSSDMSEYLIEKTYLEYKKFYAERKNLIGVSLKDILGKQFNMNLPPSRKARAEIMRDIHENLVPAKFPFSVMEYTHQQQKEAEKKYPLAKIGDTVTVRSSRLGNYTGVFNGFGAQKGSVQIDRKFFAIYDLTRKSKALFDVSLNEIIRSEYVKQQCDQYKEEIRKFCRPILKTEMRNRGYLYRERFFSPSEYLNALEMNRFKNRLKPKQVFLEEAKQVELKKLSSSRKSRFTRHGRTMEEEFDPDNFQDTNSESKKSKDRHASSSESSASQTKKPSGSNVVDNIKMIVSGKLRRQE